MRASSRVAQSYGKFQQDYAAFSRKIILFELDLVSRYFTCHTLTMSRCLSGRRTLTSEGQINILTMFFENLCILTMFVTYVKMFI